MAKGHKRLKKVNNQSIEQKFTNYRQIDFIDLS